MYAVAESPLQLALISNQRSAAFTPRREPASYPCPGCRSKFSTRQGLGVHLKRMHAIASTFPQHRQDLRARLDPTQCPDCRRRFDSEKDLALHCAFVHGQRREVKLDAPASVPKSQLDTGQQEHIRRRLAFIAAQLAAELKSPNEEVVAAIAALAAAQLKPQGHYKTSAVDRDKVCSGSSPSRASARK